MDFQVRRQSADTVAVRWTSKSVANQQTPLLYDGLPSPSPISRHRCCTMDFQVRRQSADTVAVRWTSKSVAYQQTPLLPKPWKSPDRRTWKSIARIDSLDGGASDRLQSKSHLTRIGSPAVSRLPTLVLIALCAVSAVSASDVDYLSQVKPLLTEKCYSCHGVLKQESSLRLETRALMIQGGDSGGVLLPGNPDESLLVERIRSTDSDRMPPHEQGSPLTADQISLIETWIRQGAKAPAELPPSAPEQHWAFQPIVRPELPRDSDASNPIDAILAAKHAGRSIRPQGRAERSLQLRRLYFDLIGLPPTTDQLIDSRPWSVIVDELLSNPHHGERWGRHWMDIWRYSDWYGLGDQLRNSQKHLWHWRDWIIAGINRDMGYDRMILEMIAGDELAPEDPDVLAATGYLARNYYLFNRTTWLDNTIEHTSKAFLGLTINCAKCHDHKYDPITQLDYYRFRAIFEPHQVRLDPVPGVTELESDGLPRVFDDKPTIKTYLHVRGDPNQPDTDNVIAPGVPGILAEFAPQIEAIELPSFAYAPGTRDHVRRDHLAAAEKAVRSAESDLQNATQSISSVQDGSQSSQNGSQSSESPAESSEIVAAQDLAAAEAKLCAARADLVALQATMEADESMVAHPLDSALRREATLQAARRQAEAQVARGQYRLLVDAADDAKVKAAKGQIKSAQKALASLENQTEDITYESLRGSRKALESPADKEPDYPAMYPRQSTGRRLALARWMTSPEQPLTARVAVNHVWLRHFGSPLVESVFDFGLRSPRPEHAELLDLLAAELMESGWSLKHLHRLIVTSEAYRRDSSELDADPRCMELDGGNASYWRMNPRRMESQVVRDALLALAGQLDRTIGGPSLAHDHSPYRRSLYLRHSPDQQDKFLEMFDDADVLSCYRRSESIVPQQALALANSQLSISMAQRIADTIFSAIVQQDDRTFVKKAFQTVLARRATEEELEECVRFLEQLDRETESTNRDPARNRGRLVHAILNHNDFITIR